MEDSNINNNNPFDDLESWLEGNVQFCENCQKLSKTLKNRETVLKKLKSRIISTDKIIKQFQLKKNELSQTQRQLADVTEKLRKADRLTQALQSSCLLKRKPTEQEKDEFEKKLDEKEYIIRELQERLKFTQSEQKIFKESSQVSLTEAEKLKDEIKRQSKLISSLEQNHKRKTLQMEKSKKEMDENKSSLSEMKKQVKFLEKELSLFKEKKDNGLLPKKEVQALNKKNSTQSCNSEEVPSVEFMSDDDDDDEVGKKIEVPPEVPPGIDVNSIMEEFRSFPQILSPIPSVDEGELDSSLESVNDLAKLLEEEFLQSSELPHQESAKVVSSKTESVGALKKSASPDLTVPSAPSLSNFDSFLKSDSKKKSSAETLLKHPTSTAVELEEKTKSNPLEPVLPKNESSNNQRGTEYSTFGILSSDSDSEEELKTSPQLTSSSSDPLANKSSHPQLEPSADSALNGLAKELQQKSPKLCKSEPPLSPLSEDKVCKVKGEMLNGPSSGNSVESVVPDTKDHGSKYQSADPLKSSTEMANSLDQTGAAKTNLESADLVTNPEKQSAHKRPTLFKSDMIDLFGSELLSSSSDDDSDEEKTNQLLTLPNGVETTSPLEKAEPPTPLGEAEPPTPLGEAEPPTPLGEAEPPTPLGEAEPPTPLVEAEPPTPLVEAEPPTPLVEAEPPTPLVEAEPPTLSDEAEPPTPSVEAEAPTPPVDTNPQNIPMENSPSIETNKQKPTSINNNECEKSLEKNQDKSTPFPTEEIPKVNSSLNVEAVEKASADKLSSALLGQNSVPNNYANCKTDSGVLPKMLQTDLKITPETNPGLKQLKNSDQNPEKSLVSSPAEADSCVAYQKTDQTTPDQEFCLPKISSVDESLKNVSSVDESLKNVSSVDESLKNVSSVDESLKNVSSVDESLKKALVEVSPECPEVSSVDESLKNAHVEVSPEILCPKSGSSETENLTDLPEKVSATNGLQEDQESAVVEENHSETSADDECSLTNSSKSLVTESREETKKMLQDSLSESPMEVELCLGSTKNSGVGREIPEVTMTKNADSFEGHQNLSSAKDKNQNVSLDPASPLDRSNKSLVLQDHLPNKSVQLPKVDEMTTSLSEKNQLDNKDNDENKTLHQTNECIENVVLKGNHRDTVDIKENHKDTDSIMDDHRDTDSIMENHIDTDSIMENHRDTDSIMENHRDTVDIMENHRDTVDIKENHKYTNSIMENHRDTADIKENHKDTDSIMENHRDTVDIKENHKDTDSIMENHRDTVFIKENHKYTNSIMENHRDTADINDDHKDTDSIKDDHKDIIASVDVCLSPTEEFQMKTKKEPELLELSENGKDTENTSSHFVPVPVRVNFARNLSDNFPEIQGKPTEDPPELSISSNLKNAENDCVPNPPDMNSSLEISSSKETVNNSPSSNAPSIDRVSEPITHTFDPCMASFPPTRSQTPSPPSGDKPAADVPKTVEKTTSSPENNSLGKKPNVLTENNTNKVDHPSLTLQSSPGEKGSLDPDGLYDVAESLLNLSSYGAINGSPSSDKENELAGVSDKSAPGGTDLKKLNGAESGPHSVDGTDFFQCNSADTGESQNMENGNSFNASKILFESGKDAESLTNGAENIPKRLGSGSGSLPGNGYSEVLRDGSRENGKALRNFSKLPQNIEVPERSKTSKEEIEDRLSSSSSSPESSRDSETFRNGLENCKRLNRFHNLPEDTEKFANIKTDPIEDIKELGIDNRLTESSRDFEGFTNCIEDKRLKDINQLSESHIESGNLRNDTEENGTKFDDSSTLKPESFELSRNGAEEEKNGTKLGSSTVRVEINESSERLKNGTKEISSENFHHSDGVRGETGTLDHRTKDCERSVNNLVASLESKDVSYAAEKHKSGDSDVHPTKDCERSVNNVVASLESKDVSYAAEKYKSGDSDVRNDLVMRENSIFSNKNNDNIEWTLSVNVNKSRDNVEETLSASAKIPKSNCNVEGTLEVGVNNSQDYDNVGGTLSVCVYTPHSPSISEEDDDVHNDSSKNSFTGDLSSMEEFSDLDSTELLPVATTNHVNNVDINELFGDDDDDDDDDPPNPESAETVPEPKNSTSCLSNDSVSRANNCNSSIGGKDQDLAPSSVKKAKAEKNSLESVLEDVKKRAQLNGLGSLNSRKKRRPVFKMAADPTKPSKLSRKSVDGGDQLLKAKTENAVINSKRKFIKFVASSEQLFVPTRFLDSATAAHDKSSPSIKGDKNDELPVEPISKPSEAILQNCLPSSKTVPHFPQKTDCLQPRSDTFTEELFAGKSKGDNSEGICELIKEFILVARPISPLSATPEKSSVPPSHEFSTPPPKVQTNSNTSTPTSDAPDCDYLKDIKPLLNMVSKLSPIVTPSKLREKRSQRCLLTDFISEDGTESAAVSVATPFPKTFAADTDCGNGENTTDPHQPKTAAAEANLAVQVDAAQSSADKKCLNTQQRLLRKSRTTRRICAPPPVTCTKNPKLDPKKDTNSTEPKGVSKNPTNAKLPPSSSSSSSGPQKMDVSLEIAPKTSAVSESEEPKKEIKDSAKPEKVPSLVDSVDGGKKSGKSVRKRKLETNETSPDKLPDEKKQCVKLDAISSRARTSLMKVAQRELQTYWKYVSSAASEVLQKLLQTNRETELIVEVVAVQAVKLLSSTTEDMLPWYITKCKSKDQTPYLSDKEKHLLRLLCLFKSKKGMGNIFSKFRECLREALAKQDWDSTSLGKWSLCRMYIAMCRFEGCLSEARVFFYTSFCHLPCEQYVTFAVVTACTWPLVLSYERIDGQVSLFRVIEYVVMKSFNEKPYNKKYLECLVKHCKWKRSGSVKDTDIQRSLFRHLQDCIEQEATKDEIFCYVKGVELLSLSEKWLWISTLLRSRMNHLIKTYLQFEPPEDRQPEFNCLLCHVFQMLGNLCMKSKERHKTITFVINSLLKPFLISDKFPADVHLCCARVIMKLYPYEPTVVYPILESWFQENLCWEPSTRLMSQWILLKNQLNKEMGVT